MSGILPSYRGAFVAAHSEILPQECGDWTFRTCAVSALQPGSTILLSLNPTSSYPQDNSCTVCDVMDATLPAEDTRLPLSAAHGVRRLGGIRDISRMLHGRLHGPAVGGTWRVFQLATSVNNQIPNEIGRRDWGTQWSPSRPSRAQKLLPVPEEGAKSHWTIPLVADVSPLLSMSGQSRDGSSLMGPRSGLGAVLAPSRTVPGVWC